MLVSVWGLLCAIDEELSPVVVSAGGTRMHWPCGDAIVWWLYIAFEISVGLVCYCFTILLVFKTHL